MAKTTQRRIGPQNENPSGLGFVVRFTPKSGSAGVKQLTESGFKVASTTDFKKASAVPNNFDGADVQYFERFGIAIVRHDRERLQPMLANAMQANVVSAVRQERSYRALGDPSAKRFGTAQAPVDFSPVGDRDYLIGYRDGVNDLVERVLGMRTPEGATFQSTFDETASTWGLQATRVVESEFSGAGIKVAVLDTGFDDGHQDFIGRSFQKKLFATNSIDGDSVGHGTHCIGTSCGPLRPGSGPRYGIAYKAEIYAGKVLGDDGYGTDRSIIAGIEWALEEGCEIISMSLGAATEIGDSPTDDYERIGKICLDAGTLIVAAAGNESRRPGRINPVGSPANASTIMAVAAVDRTFAPAPFSCGGLNPGQDIDIAAPGVDILSCLPGNSYDRWDGTSMATPHVAGVAALLAESDPQLRGWALWARLTQLAKPLSSPARDVGKGLLQAK